jgi:hypothetical protein
MKPIHIIFVFLAVGCQGALDTGPQTVDSADMESPDQAQNTDTAGPGENDMAADQSDPVDLCAATTCPDDATCNAGQCLCDAGFNDDGAGGCAPIDPCAATTCPYGATCNSGQCLCDAGFNDDGAGGCNQVVPGDTAARSRDAVCVRWTNDQPKLSQAMWQVEPTDACDQGVLHPVVITDALRRTSLFRWLVGLPGVTSMPQFNATTQACATTLAASNRGLSHSLDSSYTCFTPEAAQGAGSSNLAQGVSHPADSVNLYVGDNGVRSLGHRRWVFNPSMGATGFGQRGSYGCMYAFDGSSQANPEYVAYPAPGFFPRNALIGYWSFGSKQLGLNDQTTVAMTRTDTGAAVTLEDVYFPGGGYGIPVVAWSVPGAAIDVEYEVTIGIGAETRTYRTTLVSCN